MKLRSLAAALLVFCFASAASAKSIFPTCSKMGSAYGPNALECTLYFNGEIEAGDSSRIGEAIRDSPGLVTRLLINSPGGDPFEALRIADVVNSVFVEVGTGNCEASGRCFEDRRGKVCASACAILFVAANSRSGTEVFLHRPAFPAAMFAALPAEDARRAYESASDLLLEKMRARRVPNSILELMMKIPSDRVEKLPDNYPAQSVWLSEWLSAKCGTQESWRKTDDFLNASITGVMCTVESEMSEQRRTQKK